MEASYEVLGDAPSESASLSEEADEESAEAQNGEGVRAEVDGFVKHALVRTGLAAVGFGVSVLGIWGDGVEKVMQSETVVFGM